MKWLIVTLALVSACKDAGAEQFVKAQSAYQQLVLEGAKPNDARFDAVLEQLRAVPQSSSHFDAAQKLVGALTRARSGGIRAPLAVAPRANSNLPPDVLAQLQQCAHLAQTLGRDGGLSRDEMKALDACREHAERLDVAHHEAEAPPIPTK